MEHIFVHVSWGQHRFPVFLQDGTGLYEAMESQPTFALLFPEMRHHPRKGRSLDIKMLKFRVPLLTNQK